MGAEHPLYGALEDMGGLADRLGELAQVPSRIARDVAADLNKLIAQEFTSGRDAYGQPWHPLKKRTLLKHGPPPLTHTGEMRGGTFAKPGQGSGIVLEAPFPAGIHQTGAGTPSEQDPGEQWGMHARPIFPDGDELPKSWEAVIERRLAEAFGRAR